MMKPLLFSLASSFSSNLSLFIPCLIIFLIRMTIKGGGGTKQACAVCKYQRRKCEKNCRLARYFPADQPKTFQNAHRLFGVSGIVKILNNVDDDKKDRAMASIIFESNFRAKYPAHGCLGLIFSLERQLQAAVDELRHVNTQLAIYREQTQYQTPIPSSNPSEIRIDVNNLIQQSGSPDDHEFYVDINEDVKPFVRTIDEQNYDCYNNYNDNNIYTNINSMFMNDYCGNIQSQMLLQGIHHDVPFVPDRDKKPYATSKGKEPLNVLPRYIYIYIFLYIFRERYVYYH